MAIFWIMVFVIFLFVILLVIAQSHTRHLRHEYEVYANVRRLREEQDALAERRK